jgi:hypothetical protein
VQVTPRLKSWVDGQQKRRLAWTFMHTHHLGPNLQDAQTGGTSDLIGLNFDASY